MADTPLELDTLDHFLWSKLSKKDRDLAALSAFKTGIQKKELSSLIAENRCSNYNLCANLCNT